MRKMARNFSFVEEKDGNMGKLGKIEKVLAFVWVYLLLYELMGFKLSYTVFFMKSAVISIDIGNNFVNEEKNILS